MDYYSGSADLVRQCQPDTPVTLFRPAALHAAAKWFTQNFPGKILYAVKANPSPDVLQGLYASGIQSFDVASLSEVQLLRQHFPTASLSFMHPIKSRKAIEQAYFDYGVRDFAFDSLEELQKIVRCTGKSKDLTLILRLAVPNTTAHIPLTGKFGIHPDEAPALLQAARRHAKRLGVSFHVGSQTMTPSAYTQALDVVGGILTRTTAKVDIVDIGGGFPSIYPDMIPPPLADYKAAIDIGLSRLPYAEQIDFWCEPGRALVAECASVLVQVELRKKDTLYINDGTYGALFDAGHVGFRFPVKHIRPNGRTSRAAVQAFHFYGPTCDSIDYMKGPFLLPEDIREGDYIEIGMLGAYGNTMRTNFNGFHADETVVVDDAPMATLYDAYYPVTKTAKPKINTKQKMAV